jgi:uncharacterized integral membrane protein
MKHKHDSPIDKVHELEDAVLKRFSRSRNTALQRYPFLFLILTTIGTILTISGFQKLIEQVQWLVSNPLLMLVIGLAFLGLTGALYKKLG